jgi:Domain of unknown function (DUF4352)
MLRTYVKIVLAGCVFLLLLVACSSPSGNGAPTARDSTPPVIVTPKSAHGSSGTGPIVVTTPTPVPSGGSQVVLKDRTLVVDDVSKQKAADDHSSLISLVLTVKNTSGTPIMNESTFFQLMGTEGDIFTYQSSSSDNFFGDIPAKSDRNGKIVFQVPTAAASDLRLFYRPEVATETVVMSLNV